jgi:hypothetical protein
MRPELNRLVWLWLFALGLAGANLAGAAGISGQVKDGSDGVSGVVISAEWRDSGRRVLSTSDQSGSFSIDLPADVAGSKTVTLFFEKPAYRSETRRLFMTTGGLPLPSELEVNLVSDKQSASTKEFETFSQAVSREGRTLFFIPYTLKADNPSEAGGQLNKNLPEGIKFGVLTRLNSIGYRKTISVDRIDAHIDAANTEKVRILGQYLNALAIVTGRGELRLDASKQRIFDVSSEFVLPAGSGEEATSDSYVEDLISEADLSNPHLGQALNEEWAHRTLIAIADKELRNRADPARIIEYLAAAKLRAASENEKSEIDAMISLARKAKQ